MEEKTKIYDEEGRVIRENRSEKKREREKIKEFAQELLKIPTKQYELLKISQNLSNALVLGKKLEGNALRRHLIYLLNLLSEENLEILKNNVLRLSQINSEKNKVIEKEINFLLENEKEGISLLIEKYPNLEIQLIRQFLREIKKFNKIPENEGKKSKHWEKLFNYLKTYN